MTIKEQITGHINEPKQLERIYRESSKEFKNALLQIYNEKKYDSLIIDVWYERLFYKGHKKERVFDVNFIFIIILALCASTLFKLPAFFEFIDMDDYYAKFAALIILVPIIIPYAIKTLKESVPLFCIHSALFGAGLLLLVFLPVPNFSQTHNTHNDLLMLTYYHFPLFLWALLGIFYFRNLLFKKNNWLKFIEFNANIFVISIIILISGIILTIITYGLFTIIDVKNIDDFIFKWFVLYGLISAPIIASYLADKLRSQLTGLMPIISRIISVLVLTVLFCFLIMLVYKYALRIGVLVEDKNLLIIINSTLFFSLSLILFSLSNRKPTDLIGIHDSINIGLITIAILIDLFTLCAAVIWIMQKGISPFRLDAIIINLIIFINLILILFFYIQQIFKDKKIGPVLQVINAFFPVYLLYVLLVMITMPLAALFF